MKTKKIKILAFILGILFLQACSKDDNPKIAQLISTLKLKKSTSDSAIITITTTQFDTYTASGLCYATSPNPTTSNSVVNESLDNLSQGKNLTGLQPNTTYYVRAFISNSFDTSYSKEISFTTLTFDIDIPKTFYSGVALFGTILYPDRANIDQYVSKIFSLEDVTHTIYGKGFTNTAMNAKMISTSDEKDYIIPTLTVVNDNTLTIKIPKELLSQNPYVKTKHYYLLLNDIYIKSKDYDDYINKPEPKPAVYEITNKDLNILAIYFTRGTPCNEYQLRGYFGKQELKNPYPNNFFAIYTTKTELIVNVEGVYFNSYPVFKRGESGSTPIGTCGYAYTINPLKEEPTLYDYHENTLINLPEKLPQGVLTFQVKNTMSDGTTVTSNEYSSLNYK